MTDHNDGLPPQLTPQQVEAESAKFKNRVNAFAQRYPYLAWFALLVLAPYFFYLAWKESRKPS